MQYTLFFKESVKLDPRLAVLKIFMIFILFFIYSYFLPIFFLTFHKTVMIYKSRNRSNYTTESQKEKETYFIAHSRGK